MRKSNFFQLQSHFPHFEHIQDASLCAVNMETAFRVLIEPVQRIDRKWIHSM